MMEKLIEKLEKTKFKNAATDYRIGKNDGIDTAIFSIRSFSHWTKVEDGLPEIWMMGRMSDLICFEVEDEKIVTGRLCVEDGYKKLIFSDTNLNDYEVSEVKKWMYIPKSKEEGK